MGLSPFGRLAGRTAVILRDNVERAFEIIRGWAQEEHDGLAWIYSWLMSSRTAWYFTYIWVLIAWWLKEADAWVVLFAALFLLMRLASSREPTLRWPVTITFWELIFLANVFLLLPDLAFSGRDMAARDLLSALLNLGAVYLVVDLEQPPRKRRKIKLPRREPVRQMDTVVT